MRRKIVCLVPAYLDSLLHIYKVQRQNKEKGKAVIDYFKNICCSSLSTNAVSEHESRGKMSRESPMSIK